MQSFSRLFQKKIKKSIKTFNSINDDKFLQNLQKSWGNFINDLHEGIVVGDADWAGQLKMVNEYVDEDNTLKRWNSLVEKIETNISNNEKTLSEIKLNKQSSINSDEFYRTLFSQQVKFLENIAIIIDIIKRYLLLCEENISILDKFKSGRLSNKKYFQLELIMAHNLFESLNQLTKSKRELEINSQNHFSKKLLSISRIFLCATYSCFIWEMNKTRAKTSGLDDNIAEVIENSKDWATAVSLSPFDEPSRVWRFQICYRALKVYFFQIKYFIVDENEASSSLLDKLTSVEDKIERYYQFFKSLCQFQNEKLAIESLHSDYEIFKTHLSNISEVLRDYHFKKNQFIRDLEEKNYPSIESIIRNIEDTKIKLQALLDELKLLLLQKAQYIKADDDLVRKINLDITFELWLDYNYKLDKIKNELDKNLSNSDALEYEVSKLKIDKGKEPDNSDDYDLNFLHNTQAQVEPVLNIDQHSEIDLCEIQKVSCDLQLRKLNEDLKNIQQRNLEWEEKELAWVESCVPLREFEVRTHLNDILILLNEINILNKINKENDITVLEKKCKLAVRSFNLKYHSDKHENTPIVIQDIYKCFYQKFNEIKDDKVKLPDYIHENTLWLQKNKPLIDLEKQRINTEHSNLLEEKKSIEDEKFLIEKRIEKITLEKSVLEIKIQIAQAHLSNDILSSPPILDVEESGSKSFTLG